MEKVPKLWVIGGTADSVKIVKTIADYSLPCLVTVTTPTAKKLYPTHYQITVKVGKLNLVEIQEFCQQENIKGIVDSSHPFAVNISQQVMEFAQRNYIPYLRYERPSLKTDDKNTYVENFDDLITKKYLKNKRVLLTVGCQGLPKFKLYHKEAVLYARILPKLDSLKIALNAGFTENKIMALRPPITLELEKALWKQWNIDLVVTKASGKPGGQHIKTKVSQELGIPLIIIKRPLLNYPQQTEQISDIIKFCCQCFGK